MNHVSISADAVEKTLEYLHELKSAWHWKSGERAGNAMQYKDLCNHIEDLTSQFDEHKIREGCVLVDDPPCGVSISQAMSGTISGPTIRLKWGEDIPEDVKERMCKGEVAILEDAQGKPHSKVIVDYFGCVRELNLDA